MSTCLIRDVACQIRLNNSRLEHCITCEKTPIPLHTTNRLVMRMAYTPLRDQQQYTTLEFQAPCGFGNGEQPDVQFSKQLAGKEDATFKQIVAIL